MLDKDVRQLEISSIVGRSVKTNQTNLEKRSGLPYNPKITFPGIYPREKIPYISTKTFK